jgi:RNA polymerase sigma-70 factor (ECF subfamily)
VAALWRRFGDADLAEESVQEAFARAALRWPAGGAPGDPAAWIVATARNVAVDRLRREKTLAAKLPLLDTPEAVPAPADEADTDAVPDDRLELIFTCCHPALPLEGQVALTLRLAGGLTTPEIARAFLVSEPVMAQRLVRAKRKMRTAGIPFRVPSDRLLGDRLDQVMAVLYLIFNEGYSASSGDAAVRRDLCAEAIRLARILAGLMPEESEPAGLLALMLLHHARAAARTAADGSRVLLEDQDRSTWDAAMIAEGTAVLEEAVARGPAGPYRVQAQIAREHARAATASATDWARIAGLYTELAALTPSPVVELNRAAAVSMAEGPARGLELLEPIEAAGELGAYHLLPAARADMLRRLGRYGEALPAYRRALELAPGPSERRFLSRRCAEMEAAVTGA